MYGISNLNSLTNKRERMNEVAAYKHEFVL